jgi:hypothetical protein
MSSAGERHCFATVADDIATNGASWKAYYELEAPESAPLPGDFSSRLSQFEVLLLLRCLRVDRVVVGITHFVIETLGSQYVTPPVLDYHAIFSQSSPTTPVVFVLSPGADPAFDVFRWAAVASLAHPDSCLRCHADITVQPSASVQYQCYAALSSPSMLQFAGAAAAAGLERRLVSSLAAS